MTDAVQKEAKPTVTLKGSEGAVVYAAGELRKMGWERVGDLRRQYFPATKMSNYFMTMRAP